MRQRERSPNGEKHEGGEFISTGWRPLSAFRFSNDLRTRILEIKSSCLTRNSRPKLLDRLRATEIDAADPAKKAAWHGGPRQLDWIHENAELLFLWLNPTQLSKATA